MKLPHRPRPAQALPRGLLPHRLRCGVCRAGRECAEWRRLWREARAVKRAGIAAMAHALGDPDRV